MIKVCHTLPFHYKQNVKFTGNLYKQYLFNCAMFTKMLMIKMSKPFIRNNLFFVLADTWIVARNSKYLPNHAKNIVVDLLTLAINFSYCVDIAVWLSPFYKVL